MFKNRTFTITVARQGEYFMNTIKFLQFRPPPGFPRIPHLTSMANSTPDIKPCPRNDLSN